MAEFGAAIVGGGFALAAAGYTTDTGFVARHENAHAQQVAEMEHRIKEFEEAYERQEVSEHDWKQFLVMRKEAREKESEYDDSIEAYKETPVYKFIQKWKGMRQVRKKKKRLRKANKLLRSHYYESTSDASDTSSTNAASGSPPRSRAAYSDEDNKRIQTWAKDVSDGNSEDEDENLKNENESCLSHVLRGHTALVTSVAISADGKHIASGSEDCTIRIWDIETGVTTVGPLSGHTGSIVAVAFSPDGKHVVSGCRDHTIRIWDAETGMTIVGPLKGHTGRIYSASFSPDGKRVVSGSHDSTVRIWDVATGVTIVGPMKAPSPLGSYTLSIHSVAFSPDGKCIVSGFSDGTIWVWNAVTGNIAAGPLKGHTNWINSVAFSPDGKQIVSGSDDNTIRIWDAKTGETTVGPLKLEDRHSRIYSVAFSPDGKYVVSGSCGCVCVWDTETAAGVRWKFQTDTTSLNVKIQWHSRRMDST